MVGFRRAIGVLSFLGWESPLRKSTKGLEIIKTVANKERLPDRLQLLAVF